MNNIGNLINYIDHRDMCVFARREYAIKWLRLVKWADGLWKAVIIIGQWRDKTMIELDEHGIYTMDKMDIYPYKEGWDQQPWNKKGSESM